MFDDNQTPAGSAPRNLPLAEPEDMFGDIDRDNTPPLTAAAPNNSALSAGVLKKKAPEDTSSIPPIRPAASSGATAGSPSPLNRVSTMPREEVYPAKEPILGKVFIVLIIIAAAIGLGYGAWLFYTEYTEETPAENIPDNALPLVSTPEIEPAVTAPETTATEEEDATEENTVIITQPVDDDGDSLSNEREAALGTNSRLADTDGDGLRDGDEVIIWSTNPLNPDSDGDGYPDGEEVAHGYNPLGPGKLDADRSSADSI